MKLAHVILCMCMIWEAYAIFPVVQRRIRLSEKGIYPADLPSVSRSDHPHRGWKAIHQRPVQQELKHTKDDLPPFFKRTKPHSLEGWLTKPKERFTPPTNIRKDALKIEDKSGFCGHYLNYGIRCGVTMNQCKTDPECPGIAKCCLVSDCGFMCVKPKEKEHHVEKTKRKTKVSDRNGLESATTPEGLKLEDIYIIP